MRLGGDIVDMAGGKPGEIVHETSTKYEIYRETVLGY